jgi:hypothetical protein
MSSWREDPDLIRQGDEDDVQQIQLPEEFEQLFVIVERMMFSEGGGWGAKAQRTVLRGFVWGVKKRVAAEPEGARAFIVEALQMIAAALRVEPLELYPDLAKEPARASG